MEAIQSTSSKPVSKWLRRLIIKGNSVIDNDGKTSLLKHKLNRTTLAKGHLFLEGDRLVREGSTGTRLEFRRVGQVLR